MNLQRYNMSNGQPFIGRAALMDTMGFIYQYPWGLVMGVYTYIRSKGNPEYLENYAMKKIIKSDSIMVESLFAVFKQVLRQVFQKSVDNS